MHLMLGGSCFVSPVAHACAPSAVASGTLLVAALSVPSRMRVHRRQWSRAHYYFFTLLYLIFPREERLLLRCSIVYTVVPILSRSSSVPKGTMCWSERKRIGRDG